MGRAHVVFVEVAAVFRPFPFQVAGGDGGLVTGGADDGVVGDPVGLGGEEIDALPVGIAAFGELFERGKFFFGAAARIVEFHVAVVTDCWEIAAVEEGAVVGEFGALVAVSETAGLVTDLEGHTRGFAGLKRLVERIDGVDVARAGRELVKAAIEVDGRDALQRVGDVNLVDGLVGFVLKDKRASAFKGSALGENVDFCVDGGDFGLRQQLVFLVVALVGGLDTAALLGTQEFVANVGVEVIPGAAGDGDDKEEGECGNETREALCSDFCARGPTIFGATA